MQPHQQRVLDEKIELDKKATALSQFIAYSSVFPTLDAAEQERLREQSEVMWIYSEILGARLRAQGLDVLPEPDFLLDCGRLRCYYEGTVSKLLAAERERLGLEKVNADIEWQDALDAAVLTERERWLNAAR